MRETFYNLSYFYHELLLIWYNTSFGIFGQLGRTGWNTYRKTSLEKLINVSNCVPIPPPSSPNPTLTLTCYQLTAVGIGKGLVRYAVAQMLILI